MSTRAARFHTREGGVLRHGDYGAGAVFKRVYGLRKRGDDRLFAGEAARKLDGRHHLRLHASGTELPLFHVLDGFGDGDMRKRPLVGLAEVDIDVFHLCEDEKDVGLHIFRETLGREVLVDDRRDAGERAVHVLDHGDSAAAGRDDDRRIPEALDGIKLDDPLRLRRGDDAAPAAAGIFLHRPALFFGDLLRLFGAVETPDRLRRLFKGGVALVYDDLRHERDDGNVTVPVAERVAEALLNLIADVALGHRAAAVEGDRGKLVGLRGRRNLLLEYKTADLRPVSVNDRHLITAAADIGQVLAGPFNDFELLLRRRRGAGLHKRVAAQGDYYLSCFRWIVVCGDRMRDHCYRALLHIKNF